MKKESPASQRARSRGMSIFEVLIAAALLLVISLGILALLTRAMANTNRGWEATVASNIVRTQLDERLGQELDSPDLTIAGGAVEVTRESFYGTGLLQKSNDDDEKWYDDEGTAKGLVLMSREETVRQYNIKQLLGPELGWNQYGNGDFNYEIGQGQLDSPLSGDTEPEFVHMKRIMVELEGKREGGPLGAGQRLRSETYKSF